MVAAREEFAVGQFQGRAEVVRGRMEGGELVYPFVAAPTLESEIGSEILRGSRGFALETVMSYRQFLDDLPRRECVPEAFFDFLGLDRTAPRRSMACVAFGPFDCIPRNLVRERGGWKVLDLEWTFEFPIPVEFIFWRGLLSLVAGLQQPIQAGASKENPVVLYCGYGRDSSLPAACLAESLQD